MSHHADNPYWRAGLPSTPLLKASFDSLVAQRCAILGLDISLPEIRNVVQYALFVESTAKRHFVHALRQVFLVCIPFLKRATKARTRGIAEYKTAALGYPKDVPAAKKAFDKFVEAQQDGHKWPAESIRELAVVVERIKAYCGLSAEELYEQTRKQGGEEPTDACLLLKAAVTIQFSIDAKHLWYVFDEYLNKVEHFEQTDDSWLRLQAERKARGPVTLGSFTKRAAGGSYWVERMHVWLGVAKNELEITDDRLVELLGQPTSAQRQEADRIAFCACLRRQAREEHFPKPRALLNYIYRAYDPHSGRNHKKVLTDFEKDGIIWWILQEPSNIVDGKILATDAMSLSYHRVDNFIRMLGKDFEKEKARVQATYGNEEPTLEDTEEALSDGDGEREDEEMQDQEDEEEDEGEDEDMLEEDEDVDDEDEDEA